MKDEYSLECKNMARNSDKEGNRLSLHRYVELDYLRAISVMCVFIVHTYGMIPWSLFQKVVSKLSLQNSVAVFFVISGFLAFSVDQETGTVEYYKNRFVRIFPVYWITFHLNIWINCFVMRTMSFDWWRYLVGLLGMQMAIPSRVYQWNGLGASGSLSAIITFYLIVPLLRKIITSRQRAFIILGGG